jgi:hypothetical protein
VALDFLFIFFRLKSFPDFYSPYRLWEKPRNDWFHYYGSTYDALQRHRLEHSVQRPEYRILFDDKEVCHYLCIQAGLPVPRLLGIARSASQIVEIASKALHEAPQGAILKPALGRAGRGVGLLTIKEGRTVVEINGKQCSLREVLWDGKIIFQEIIGQHSLMAYIFPFSLNTIRISTFFTAEGEVVFLGASARFGTKSLIVDNWSAGGVAVGVDIKSGELMRHGFDKTGTKYLQHPTSGKAFYGFQLPFWKEVISLAERTQRAFPYYRLIGVDVAVTHSGPVVIEINSQPDLVFQEQTSGAILKNPRIRRAFSRENLLVCDRR